MKGKILFISLLFALPCLAQNLVSDQDKARAAELISQMTLEEKIDYLGGVRRFYLRDIERLGIPEIRMSDGPQGIRNYALSTLYPCGIASAASWDREMVGKVGKALGLDARSQGIHILLGPGVNIYRMPLCGRNFEYFGEDPFLCGEIASAYIKGVQSQGVMATVKHFAVNNIEGSRHVVDAVVDERTLHEIYLPAFEKAVKEAGVACVMDSYNLINGVHASENGYLNKDILRTKWGFEGIVMSDWTSVYSTIGAVYGGLDLEMPSAVMLSKDRLLPLIENGVIDEGLIDEKLQHLLQSLIAFGFLDRPQLDSSIPVDNPLCDEIALEAARGSMVLLKNDGLLPLTEGKIVVCGPNAGIVAAGGGSGFVSPFHSVSPIEGMAMAGGGVSLESDMRGELVDFYTDGSLTRHGATVSYFDNADFIGDAVRTETTGLISYNWAKSAPVPEVGSDNFGIRYSLFCKPEYYTEYLFDISCDDGIRVWVDGEKILEKWETLRFRHSSCTFALDAERTHRIDIEYRDTNGDARIEFRYAGMLDNPVDIAAVEDADAVVFCMGYNFSSEQEGLDREYELPAGQLEYLDKVLAHNDNVVVLLNSGGSVNFLPWSDKVKAVIMAWYGGQQGGLAAAEIITGKISPSGKLPISIEKEFGDLPCAGSYYSNTARVRKENMQQRVEYNEGIFVGYRGFDRTGTEPLFPFGYGLSYSEFEYSDPAVSNEEGSCRVSFTLTNTGSFDAAEVAQVYVRDVESSLVCPEKELKGFEKVFLEAGESRRIEINLDDRAFSHYDPELHSFVLEAGDFDILVGSSSRSLPLSVRKSIK